VAQFKRGDFSACDAPRPGRNKTVITPEIIEQNHQLILEDRRISTKSIADQLGISHERVGSIIHEDLDMRKSSSKLLPKYLNTDQKRQRCQSSEQLLEFFRRDRSNFLSRLVTMDGHGYITVIRRQSNNQWSEGIAAHPAPKDSECKYALENFSSRFFADQDGNLPSDYLPKGQTVNAVYYSSLMEQLKDVLKEKRRGNFTKGVLFLHDNVPSHQALATQKKLAYLGFQYIDHPPYSPDLAPSDYHLFLGLENN